MFTRSLLVVWVITLGSFFLSNCKSSSKGSGGSQNTSNNQNTGSGAQNNSGSGQTSPEPSESETPSNTPSMPQIPPGNLSEFQILTPQNGENISSLLPLFSWQLASNATSYRLIVQLLDSPVTIGGPVGVSEIINELLSSNQHSFMPSTPLQSNKGYRWTVVAYNASNSAYAVNGPLYFTTNISSGGFALLTPANFSVTDSNTPTLTWSAHSNTNNYLVVIAHLPEFTSLISTGYNTTFEPGLAATVSGTSYTVPSGLLMAGQEYMLCVYAVTGTNSDPDNVILIRADNMPYFFRVGSSSGNSTSTDPVKINNASDNTSEDEEDDAAN
ncbi:MAG: hypothetical protein HY606_15330 [Planctomycetes bacterium]|nr:hypothetical protein [Planctomycetota bacterium]